MKRMILLLVLAVLAGCEAPVVKANANIDVDPDFIAITRHKDKRAENEKVEYIGAHRVALSSFRETSMVWLTGNIFHNSFNCPKAANKKGETIFFLEVIKNDYQPDPYCIDKSK